MNTQTESTTAAGNSRESRLTREEYNTIQGAIYRLDFGAAESMADFAGLVVDTRKTEFFENLATYIAGLESLNEIQRKEAARGLEEAAKFLYYLQEFRESIDAAGAFFEELEAARNAEYKALEKH